jgi:hypothetical protein
MVKTFPADGADKAFRVRVHIRGVGNGGNALNIIPPVREMLQFARIVVYQVRVGE